MTRYRLDIATESDDASLRRLLAQQAMPGMISLAFTREPSYLRAAVVDGRDRQIFVGKDLENGETIGTGTRSWMNRLINGVPTPIGYLSSLRLAAPYRNQGLIARAFAQFRRLHADGKTSLYLTTIAADNTRAVTALTGARAGLPAYHPAGAYHTFVLSIPRKPRVKPRTSRFKIRCATLSDVDEIVRFLKAHGSTRQFFPCYEPRDFFTPEGLFHGLNPDDLLLTVDGDQIVGTFGLWNQQAFRQQMVTSYRQPLRAFRPLLNAVARLSGMPVLPDIGQPMRTLFAAIPMTARDDKQTFDDMLSASLDAAAGKADYLLLGLHERDPMLPVMRQKQAVQYVTNLYLVCWSDGEPLRRSLDSRPPYLELGAL